MAEVSIRELDDQARWSLRMPGAAAVRLSAIGGWRVALDINRCADEGGRLAARLGPDEWLLCAPPAAAGDLARVVATTLAGEHHSLVDVAHRYRAFAIAGPQAPALLAAGCPIDLEPAVFGPGVATRTLLGKAEIVLWRLAGTYRIECGRTFAPYIAAFLGEAAREFSAD